MKTYNYDDNIYDGNGEGFIFSEKNCALSFFRSPNNNNLKGIGLHIHPECDDIDILLKGELTLFSSWKDSVTIKAPCIVTHKAGIAHAVISRGEKPALMYGFRSPFKGGIIVERNKKLITRAPQIFRPNEYCEGSYFLFESEFTNIYLHINQNFIPERKKYYSRSIINLSSQEIKINKDKKCLLGGSILYDGKLKKIKIQEQRSILVELIAKGIFNET